MTDPRSRRRFRVLPLAGLLAAGVLVGAAYVALRGREPIDVRWASVMVRVPNLDCRFWCSVKLATILEAMPGVRVEHFDVEHQTARVRYDAHRVDEHAIFDRLAVQGVVAERVEKPGS